MLKAVGDSDQLHQRVDFILADAWSGSKALTARRWRMASDTFMVVLLVSQNLQTGWYATG